jgi:hypothetical protein
MEKRSEIEAEMIAGKALTEIERKYGISNTALQNHRDRCIPGLIARARAELEVFTAENLLSRLEEVRAETWEIYRENKINDPGLALKALGRMENQLAFVR